MDEKSIFRRTKPRRLYFKEITDEYATIKRLVKEVYGETTNKKSYSQIRERRKIQSKNKKPCIVFDERRHKSRTIKNPFIDDDVITKRRLRDTLKRGF